MVIKLLVLGVLAYAVVLLLVWIFHPRMIFLATRAIYRDPSAMGWAFEDLQLPVAGETTHGWFVPLEGARGVVLFSHGNAGNIADRLESIGLLRSFGFSVLAYDYGGYGKSTGGASEPRCYADIRAMWGWLTETRGISPDKIVVFGRSLGGGVTADLAREVHPATVVLESTFLSMPEVGKDHFPWLPVIWMMRPRFENKAKVGQITSPLLIIHSPEDRTIPFYHGQELYRRAQAPKTFLQISGDHNMGFVESGEVYRKGWETFLAPLLPWIP